MSEEPCPKCGYVKQAEPLCPSCEQRPARVAVEESGRARKLCVECAAAEARERSDRRRAYLDRSMHRRPGE